MKYGIVNLNITKQANENEIDNEREKESCNCGQSYNYQKKLFIYNGIYDILLLI